MKPYIMAGIKYKKDSRSFSFIQLPRKCENTKMLGLKSKNKTNRVAKIK